MSINFSYMKYSKLARIYFPGKLTTKSSIYISQKEKNYIKNVLRIKSGGKIRVFNQIDGEFLATLNVTQNDTILTINEKFRTIAEEETWDLVLLLPLIKSDKFELACDMATQMGVTRILPIITERTGPHKLNLERLEKIILESVRQSERLSLPVISEPVKLFLIFSLPLQVIFANEMEESNFSFPEINKEIRQNIGLLVGPEGGFTEQEIDYLKKNGAVSISLGQNVLRTETAAVSLLSKFTT
ncbi:MAG: RsmE family RNA methyltransferase [Rickettsiaceae bacterium]|nr:RsmE family RNA methyltransferase [Rickettsiaceae bacterium]